LAEFETAFSVDDTAVVSHGKVPKISKTSGL
jgi:hypothetical protein